MSSHTENPLQVELRIKPGDEVSAVTVRIPAGMLAKHQNMDMPLIAISSLTKDENTRPIEISDLKASAATANVYRRVNAQSVTIHLEDFRENNGIVTFEFKAWELVGPLQGIEPYLYAILAAHISFPAFAGIPVMVTIATPDYTAPRSTQGNYSLAYPSRTFEGSRYTNIYFSDAVDIRLKYRCAGLLNFRMPWQTIGKTAVAAAFVYFISSLIPDARGADLSERLLAVIGAFVASSGTMWDFIQEITVFTVYERRKNRLVFLVLACQLSVITLMILTLIRLSTPSTAHILGITRPLAGLLTLVLLIIAIVGFFLHSRGWWQGYTCDATGCGTQLRIRKGRPECRYTGRVFCDEHMLAICQNCCHGADLLNRGYDSMALYSVSKLPCVIKPASTVSSVLLRSERQPGQVADEAAAGGTDEAGLVQ